MRKAKIIGTGMAVPDCVVDNHLLARCFTTSDEWITQRTGIKERRVTPSTYRFLLRLAEAPDKDAYIREVYERGVDGKIDAEVTPATLGREAAEMAVKNAGLQIDDIDFIDRDHDDPRVRVPAHGRRHVGEVRPHVDAGAEPPAGVLGVRVRARGGGRVHPDRHLPAGPGGRRRGALDDARVLGPGPRHGRPVRGRRRRRRAPGGRRELPERVHLAPPSPGRHGPRPSSSARSTAPRPTRSCRRRRSTTGGPSRR